MSALSSVASLSREAHHEAVVRPHRFDFEAAFGAKSGGDGHAPGRMNAAAEGSEHADSSVAQFITANFHEDVFVAGDAASGGNLVFQITQQDFPRRWHPGCVLRLIWNTPPNAVTAAARES